MLFFSGPMPEKERGQIPRVPQSGLRTGRTLCPGGTLAASVANRDAGPPVWGERVPLNAPGEGIEFKLWMGLKAASEGAGRGNSLPAGEGVSVGKRFP